MSVPAFLRDLEKRENQDKTKWAVQLRYLITLGSWLVAMVAHPFGVFPTIGVIHTVALATVVANSYYWYRVCRWEQVIPVWLLSSAGDWVGITAVVHYTGGLSSPFVMLYLIELLGFALFGNLPLAILGGTWGTILFGAMIVLDQYGISPHHPTVATAQPFADGAFVLTYLALFVFYLALVGYMSGFIAERLRSKEQAETLRRISQVLSSTLELGQLPALVLEQLRQLVPYDYAALLLLEGEGLRMLAVQGCPHLGAGQPFLPSAAQAFYRQFLAGRKPLILADARGEGWACPGGCPQPSAWMGIPWVRRSEPIGLLVVGKAEPGYYNEGHAQVAELFAGHAALALETARLLEAERERAKQLSTLNEIAQAVSALLGLDQVLETIYQQTQRIIPLDAFFIGLVDKAANKLKYVLLYDLGVSYPQKWASLPEGSATGRVAETGESLLINRDPEKLEELSPLEGRMGNVDRISASLMYAPLLVGTEVIGVISAQSYHPYAYTPQHLELLQGVASHAAIAIENARLYEQMEQLAVTDGLTGLYNRRHFYRLLETELARVDRYNSPLSLIMMDIDEFKAYNDRYGHLAGDRLLRQLAEILRRFTRQGDAVARYGGEEFALILPHTGGAGALSLAERVRVAVEGDELDVGERLALLAGVTVSAGVAAYPEHAAGVEALVHAADMALYAAKAAGKNCVRSYSALLGEGL